MSFDGITSKRSQEILCEEGANVQTESSSCGAGSDSPPVSPHRRLCPVDPPPAVFYGTAYVDNVPVAGATVSGWIDGAKVAETTTEADGSYYLKVEGNFHGKTVFFKVAGYDALWPAIWEIGRIVLLDLHATKAPLPAPLPVMPGIPFVIFDGWYVDGSEVNTTSEDKTVTARITLQWGDPGRYRMRIRRDVAWGFDETVKELEFDYDGGVATKELSFQPPYATNENDTAGYHVDIQRYRLPLFTLLGGGTPYGLWKMPILLD